MTLFRGVAGQHSEHAFDGAKTLPVRCPIPHMLRLVAMQYAPRAVRLMRQPGTSEDSAIGHSLLCLFISKEFQRESPLLRLALTTAFFAVPNMIPPA